MLEITSGSLRTNSDVDWAKDSSSVSSLADGFLETFKDILPETTSDPTEYSLWFNDLVSSLNENELLVFYSDYGGKHQHHLESAPGYVGQGLQHAINVSRVVN